MVTWIIDHNQYVPVILIAFAAGVLFAAWREEVLRDRRWVKRLRSNVRP